MSSSPSSRRSARVYQLMSESSEGSRRTSPRNSQAGTPSKRSRASRGTPSRSSRRLNPEGGDGLDDNSTIGGFESLLDEQPPASQRTLDAASERGSELGSRRGLNLGYILSDPFEGSSPLNFGSSEGNIRSLKSPSRSHGSFRRADIATDSRLLRQINISDVHPDRGDASEGSRLPDVDDVRSQSSQTVIDPQLVIWGTDVSVSVCKAKFKQFIRWDGLDIASLEPDELDLLNSDGNGGRMDVDADAPIRKSLYLLKLEDIYALGDYPYLDVNCAHIHQFDADLYRQLINYPQEVIPAFDMATNELFFEIYPDAQLSDPINIRPYNVMQKDNLRSLNPEDINQLKTVNGMVTRISNLIPEMKTAFFACSLCQSTSSVEVDRGRIHEPTLCPHCNTKYSYQLVHNMCEFIDKQQIKLQESPDDMPAGQTPYTALLYACADLVDSVQPGDRVTVTGIYRASAIRSNPRQRSVKAIFKSHIDVVHFRKHDKNRLHSDDAKYKFTPERVDKIKQLSQLPDLYERLAHALAPSIYEHLDIKKGILLQLFGGTHKEPTNDNAKQKHFRSEINILLCGDPGTSKSQLLQYVYGLVPRGQYTSGKGSSAVGLTAYVTKDADTNQLVLQTGALVLSDGGICCIDEFDKMTDSTRSVLHEVMEQQTLSIAKAGIVCQLNARTSILAAANPVESQWNKNKTIIENIQLPHTLMSRFDLIFLLLDPQDENYDRRLARHLVSLYYRSREEEEEEHLDIGVIRDYISYARMHCFPKLSDEARSALIHSYVEMRKVGIGKGMVSAYPRQLEALIRLAEAHAKVRLSNVVTLADVEEAKRLHREAIKQSATDPISGKIDVSILTTGMSASIRKKRAVIAKTLKELLMSKSVHVGSSQDSHQFSSSTIYQELKSDSDVLITREMFEDALKDLQDEGFLVVLAGKFIRLTHAEI
ncbi:DNA replication licensing factor mcm4-A [Tetranychus urticae]|uniref:DNA replication licensing factor MCM4 n=1 Tax=Tetranychus urticae TaxID=32264 RepID=T1KLU7_TETUR|nr:DNA replication licensing factor mcm4-A [Tetranychus urticae]